MLTDQIKLYSCCCLAIKEIVFYCPSGLQTHTRVRLKREIGAMSFGTCALRQKAGQNKSGVNKRLCWNLSKANNHSGAGEEYYIRVPNQYHITLTIGVYTRLIKLMLQILMLQWQFHLLGPSTTTTVQLPGLCVN